MEQEQINQALRKLPDPVREFFFTDEPRIFCEEACLSYGLPESAVPATTKPLGAIFAVPSRLREYPDVVSHLSNVDLPVAYGIASLLNRKVFSKFPDHFTDAAALGKEWDSKKASPTVSPEEVKRKIVEWEPWMLERPEAEEEERETTIASMPLLQALGEYPKLGEQPVTEARIAVPGKQDPVRPSLSNWIRAYRGELGVGYHEPTVRAKFLFDSANGKRLSSEERERLNVIIRSIEENEPVDIDTKREAIVFPGRPEADRSGGSRPAAKAVAPSRPAPGDSAPPAAVRPEPPKAPSPFSAPSPAPATPRPAPEPRESAPPASLPVSPAPRRAPGPVPDLNRPAGPRIAPAPDTFGKGKISFSSGHSLPGEHGVITPHGFSGGASAPRAGIRPLRPEREETSLRGAGTASGRVVDLREEAE